MRVKFVLALSIAAICCAWSAQSASAMKTQILRKPAPDWLTPSLRAQIHEAGAAGVQVAGEYLNTECPGFQARA